MPHPYEILPQSAEPFHSTYSFSLRTLLRQVAELGRGARMSYIPTQPSFKFPDVTVALIDYHRVAWSEYLNVIREICGEFGSAMVSPPLLGLDETGIFTDLKFSVNPNQRDLHLNAEYGRMLWDALLA